MTRSLSIVLLPPLLRRLQVLMHDDDLDRHHSCFTIAAALLWNHSCVGKTSLALSQKGNTQLYSSNSRGE